MIDKRIGKRIKECREKLGMTQEDFSEKTKFSVNYISMVERGGSFPRCERLITIINTLGVSADAIFCDVIEHSAEYKANEISKRLSALPAEEQQRILEMLDLMTKQAEGNQYRRFTTKLHELRAVFYFLSFISTIYSAIMV